MMTKSTSLWVTCACVCLGWGVLWTSQTSWAGDKGNGRKAGVWRAPSKTIANGGARNIMQVTLRIQLRHRRSIRTRRSVFQMYMRARTKTIRMKNGAAWLNLVVSMKPPREIGFKGALQLGSFFTPIEIKPRQIDPSKPWKMVVNSKLKQAKASAVIDIKAEMLSSVKSGGKAKNNYKMDFKNVSLQRILTRLAEFNNLKLALQPNVPKVAKITLKLKASSRKALIFDVCKRYSLNCKVLGKVLWVKAGVPVKRR